MRVGSQAVQGLASLALEPRDREFFTDNLLVRIHFIIVMIRWTGLAPWELELPFPGSLTSTFLVHAVQGLASLALEPKLAFCISTNEI